MKKVFLVLILCFMSANVFAFQFNGRWWNNEPEYVKVFYIQGFSESYTVERHYNTSLKDNYPYGYNFGEIVEFTTSFYENPQYRRLPVAIVLKNIVFPALKNSWSNEYIDQKAKELLKTNKNLIEILEKENEKKSSKVTDDIGYQDDNKYNDIGMRIE